MDESPNEIILVQFVISEIGLFVNVPHLLILLHNSMRTSSTNSIMIGIAICDLVVLSEFVYERVQGYWFYGSQNPCMNPDNYWYTYSIHVAQFLRAVFERASFGLGLFLAFTRLVIMKKAGNSPQCCLYKIEIRKSAKFASKALNSRISEERLRTCRMILVMSIFYIISSAPAGMSQFVTIFFTLEYQSIQATLFVYGVHFISALVCLNASLHGIINFTMSSKYRQTAKKCLGMEKQQRGSIASITTT
ncbi:hypothetical protein B9Z55_017326 [Caenorhabditis nigoni]|uniref:G-protein coupled receptors family 1 profile domain-containing protein n=1 Tax=Caenorhabditis nigoni TaxID=1611254 RepID=A0A2G5T916_9PELO|nr:hypothetical protein B9Z55_017326 [Caenorhabditis nigoni]